MKQNLLLSFMLLFVLSICLTSCSDEETITIDTSMPNGTFSVVRSGSLIADNDTPTKGTVELGTDTDGVNFLHFANDFTTELGTGTVSVYFSTSATFTADPANGNPDLILVGSIQKNGEQFIKLSSSISNSFTHVILWCNTASIPFGVAEL